MTIPVHFSQIEARLNGHDWKDIKSHENQLRGMHRVFGSDFNQAAGYQPISAFKDRVAPQQYAAISGDQAAFEANLRASRPDLMRSGVDKINPVSMAGEPVGAKNATEFGQQLVGNIATMTLGGVAMNKAWGAISSRLGGGGHVVVGERVENPIQAMHASPHDFERFSMEHLGKGEGKHADLHEINERGNGLYFSTNPEIHDFYMGSLAEQRIGGKAIDYENPLHIAASQVKLSGSRETAIEDLLRREASAGGQLHADDKAALDILQSGQKVPDIERDGIAYKVNLHMDQDKILDLNKKMTDQPEGVRKALGIGDGKAGTGQDFFNDLVEQHGSTKLATDELSAKGVHGTQYYDAASREAGMAEADRTRNYVAFHDDRVQMLEKNGAPVGLDAYRNAYNVGSFAPAIGPVEEQ